MVWWIARSGRSGTLDNMDQPQGQPLHNASPKGRWVVAALLVSGVVAGAITVSYWRSQARWMDRPSQDTSPDAAGAAPWDEQQAKTQLESVQQQFNQIAADHRQAQPVLQEAKRLVERYPQYAPTRTLLGQILLYDEQFDQAYDQFLLSLDLDGQQPEVQLLAGTLAFKLDRVDRATHHYLMAVGLDTANPRYRLHLAQAYLKQRQDQLARDALLEALRIDSSLHEAYAMLSDMYAKQNRLSLALPQIQAAIDQAPASQRSQQTMYVCRKAQLLRRANRADEALLTLQGLDTHQQRQIQVMQEVALCWSALGQPDQAAVVFEQAMADDPTQWSWVAHAAHWRFKAGQPDAARRHLATLQRINPRAPMIPELEASLAEHQE